MIKLFTSCLDNSSFTLICRSNEIQNIHLKKPQSTEVAVSTVNPMLKISSTLRQFFVCLELKKKSLPGQPSFQTPLDHKVDEESVPYDLYVKRNVDSSR